MADDFKIEGLDEALKKMRGLAPALKKKAIGAAARRAMRIVRDAARQNAKALDDPASLEKIYKNITIRAGRKSRDSVTMRVGVMGGARDMTDYGEFGGAGKANPGGDTWYWRLLEFGTEQIPARPFMRPALENNAQSVTDAFTDYLGPAIDKAVAKAR